MQELTDDQAAILDFERLHWTYPGAKEQAVRERFDLSLTTYYQRLNAIIDLEAALIHDPLLTRRLRRLRTKRREHRDAIRRTFPVDA